MHFLTIYYSSICLVFVVLLYWLLLIAGNCKFALIKDDLFGLTLRFMLQSVQGPPLLKLWTMVSCTLSVFHPSYIHQYSINFCNQNSVFVGSGIDRDGLVLLGERYGNNNLQFLILCLHYLHFEWINFSYALF